VTALCGNTTHSLYNFGFKDPEITEVFFNSQRYGSSRVLYVSVVWCITPNSDQLAV